MSVLILGMGNLLLGDEGIGVHAARALQERPRRTGVTVLEIGTAILDALPALESADRVIVIDAVKADGIPGSIYRIALDDCERNPVIGSMHGFDIQRVVALCGRRKPPQVTVIGVEPETITWSLELSERLQRTLPTLLAQVEREAV